MQKIMVPFIWPTNIVSTYSASINKINLEVGNNVSILLVRKQTQRNLSTVTSHDNTVYL